MHNNETYTTMESEYHINFEKSVSCKDCPLRDVLNAGDSGGFEG